MACTRRRCVACDVHQLPRFQRCERVIGCLTVSPASLPVLNVYISFRNCPASSLPPNRYTITVVDVDRDHHRSFCACETGGSAHHINVCSAPFNGNTAASTLFEGKTCNVKKITPLPRLQRKFAHRALSLCFCPRSITVYEQHIRHCDHRTRHAGVCDETSTNAHTMLSQHKPDS
jgi:hypothetical protein